MDDFECSDQNWIYKNLLFNLYKDLKCQDAFEKDYKYLIDSILQIENLWESAILNLKCLKVIILSEAPLWGKERRFIYNPHVDHSQFFYFDDLSLIAQNQINSKFDFIQELNSLGIVVLDFSPFPFNKKITRLNYRENVNNISRKIPGKFCKRILEETKNYHLIRKLEQLKLKMEITDLSKVSFCYRYMRVQKNLDVQIRKILESVGFNQNDEIPFISQSGGGIDRKELKQIYSKTRE